jgi:hypothetical protein
MRRNLFWLIFFILVTSFRPELAWAQDHSPAPVSAEQDNANPEPVQQGPTYIDFLSKLEFWLSILVLAFGVFVIVIEYRLLTRTRATAVAILRVYAVTVILIGSLFLITAGYSSTQISPISGLFGTVAGYLLGRSHNIPERRRKPASSPKGDE